MTKYDIYDTKTDTYLKRDCTYVATIEANFALSDEEVINYFGIDDCHREWDNLHRPWRVRRYVFDKAVVPENPRFQMLPRDEE